ncbi:MAG: type II toxin-antitoxin system VapC family toxin [Bryobacteraceae bacterium]
MLTSDLSGPRPLLLDTHIWIWASGNAGGPTRFAAWVAPWIELAARERRLLASVASVWEIALKSRRGDLAVHGDLHAWVKTQTKWPGVRVVPMTSSMVISSVDLPPWTRRDGAEHKDPSDRFLVAKARLANAILVTCDELILDYAGKGKHLVACDARRT